MDYVGVSGEFELTEFELAGFYCISSVALSKSFCFFFVQTVKNDSVAIARRARHK